MKLLDETSEKIGREFSKGEGNYDINSFLDQYLQKRSEYHSLQLKLNIITSIK